MPTLRRSFRTVEGVQECDQCSKAAEIVIEEYPTRFEHKNLCRECATFALEEHPTLLAAAVVSLILRNDRAIAA